MPRDLIVFAGALYDSPLWTNRQHIATRLAQRGWRVLYIEPRLLLPRMLLGRFPGVRGRLPWLLRMNVPWKAAENLWVVAQFNVFPWSREVRWISLLNHWLNAWGVWFWARLLRFQNPTLLLYDTEAAQFLSMFPRAHVVYDCVDDHRAQAGVDRNPSRVTEEEEQIARRADAIAVTTEPLRERFLAISPFSRGSERESVRLVPNAADVQAFLAAKDTEPSDIASIPHPRIGSVGALDAYKVDVPLMAEMARTRPDWQFVLVGPVDSIGHRAWGMGHRAWGSGHGAGNVDVASLRQHSNIHFLGAKPREQVPSYVHAFDVAIIPYRESPYNRSSFPLKFWEFMATGKPIVATGLPSLRPYGQFVTLAASPESFIAGVEQALKNPSAGQERRRAEAQKHDWTARVAAIEKLLVS